MSNFSFFYNGTLYSSIESFFRIIEDKFYRLSFGDGSEVINGSVLLQKIRAGEYENCIGTIEGPVGRS